MIESIAERVAEGAALSEAEAREIVQARDLIAVGMLGDEVRRRLHGARTTFNRVFEVHCGAVPAALPAGAAAGEVRLVGVPESLDAAIDAVRRAAAAAGDLPLSGFLLSELAALAEAADRPLDLVCRALRQAGLEQVAGVSLEMADAVSAIQASRRGGLAVTRLLVQTLPDDDRVASVLRARDIQVAVDGLKAFAPLPREVPVTQPTTGYDDVKQIALARVIATNIPSIQVDWTGYGPKLAQVALTVGADDVDGVAAVESGALGMRRSAIEEIRGNIRAAALEPVERNGRWEVIGA